jgi:hypothetical protein
MKDKSVIGLERPSFGQSARKLVGLRSEQLEACLDQQRQMGGRLGEILHTQGLISAEQIQEVLRYQARWVAAAMQADLKPHGLPYRAFLSLCMPAYNEESNIKDTLDTAIAILPEFVQRFEIIVVNDGSADATKEVVSSYAEREPRIRLIDHEHNRGYGAAVTSGLRAARGDLVAFTDSDGQFSFLDLPLLLAQLPGSDVVVGYRYQRADHCVRRLNAWCWNWLIRTMLGVQIRDLDCAFKLFRREVVDGLQLTATGAGINAEIMAQCTRAGLRIRETPVTHYPRYHGAPTGAALRVILRAFRELPRLWKYRYTSIALSAAASTVASEPERGPVVISVTKHSAANGAPTPLVLPVEVGTAVAKHAHSGNGHKSAIPIPR